MNEEENNSALTESEDMQRWEMDVNPWLDRVYNELLGKSRNDKGEWVDNPYKIKTMNEKGASEFVNEINTRVSIHMQLSELKKEDIITIASRSSEIYGNKLRDNWKLWGIVPNKANLQSIAWRLYDTLFILLMIAVNGGMKKHRERSKAPQFPMPETKMSMGEL